MVAGDRYTTRFKHILAPDDGIAAGRRSGGGTERIPDGIGLYLDPGRNYVKNLELLYGCQRVVVLNGGAVINYQWNQNGEIAFNDDAYKSLEYRELRCEKGWYIAAVKLRYDISKGKIRDFAIECRKLVYHGE